MFLCVLGLAVGAGGATWAAFSSSTSTPSNSFSAASSFCSGSAYSPTWLTGFEAGVASSAGTGLYDIGLNASIDSSIKRSGSYSAKLTASGTGAYIAKAVGGAANATFRFAVRFETLPSADVVIAGLTAAAGNGLNLGYRNSDKKLTLRWGTGTLAASTNAIAASTWYVIDLRASLGANPRTADWRVDGTTETSVSSAETASVIAYIGPGTSGADSYTAYYDDILLTTSSSDYPIGAGSVLALEPDGVGTHNNSGNFREEDNTAIDSSSWNRLDEVPLNSTSDSVRQTTASNTSYLVFTFNDTSASCIKAVSGLVAYTSATTGTNAGKTSVFNGSTENVIYSGNMAAATTLRYASAAVAPSGSTSWTTSAVNGLTARVGYSSDISPIPDWEALQLNYESQ